MAAGPINKLACLYRPAAIKKLRQPAFVVFG